MQNKRKRGSARKMIDLFFVVTIMSLLAAITAISYFNVAKINEAEKIIEQLDEALQEEKAAKSALDVRVQILEYQKNAYQSANQKLLNQINEMQQEAGTESTNDPITEYEKEIAKKQRIPEGATNMFMCMDYRKITNTRSDQYKLQQECETSEKTGIRLYCGKGEDMAEYYCAALGSAYGRDIGDTWRVTLDNGAEFNIILADFKDDGTTDFFGHPCFNYEKQKCTNVIEFVVEMEYVPERVRLLGTMSALDWCNGNIVDMEYTGRAWKGVEE